MATTTTTKTTNKPKKTEKKEDSKSDNKTEVKDDNNTSYEDDNNNEYDEPQYEEPVNQDTPKQDTPAPESDYEEPEEVYEAPAPLSGVYGTVSSSYPSDARGWYYVEINYDGEAIKTYSLALDFDYQNGYTDANEIAYNYYSDSFIYGTPNYIECYVYLGY